MKDEVISAFAFNVGRELEKIVEERNGNLSNQLEVLQVSLFCFRRELEQAGNENMIKLYDTYFNITNSRDGKL